MLFLCKKVWPPVGPITGNVLNCYFLIFIVTKIIKENVLFERLFLNELLYCLKMIEKSFVDNNFIKMIIVLCCTVGKRRVFEESLLKLTNSALQWRSQVAVQSSNVQEFGHMFMGKRNKVYHLCTIILRIFSYNVAYKVM